MATKLSNNATTRLAASISSTATQISVTAGDGAKFPTVAAGDSFPVTLVKSDGQLEIVKCTARSGDLLTVVRAQEGTTPKAFTAGDRAELRMTEATLDAYTNERATKAVQDAIATDTEATARSSKTKTLSPHGLRLNIQQSANDATSGLLMEVGKSFGLGSFGAANSYDRWPSASLDDLNVPAGMYYVSTEITERPTTEPGIVWHRQAGTVAAQIYVSSESELLFRGRRAGVYRAWQTTLNVGKYGLGSGTVTPPNGRDNVNPFGWYYAASPVPTWGGGQFFLDMPYGTTSQNAGLRLSTTPYTDDFYLNGGVSGKKEYRPACKLWHDKNFDPDSKASTQALTDGLALKANASDLSGKADKTITITGTGDLTGGGSLAANRTIDLSAAAKAKLNKANNSLEIHAQSITAAAGYIWYKNGLIEQWGRLNSASGRINFPITFNDDSNLYALHVQSNVFKDGQANSQVYDVTRAAFSFLVDISNGNGYWRALGAIPVP